MVGWLAALMGDAMDAEMVEMMAEWTATQTVVTKVV